MTADRITTGILVLWAALVLTLSFTVSSEAYTGTSRFTLTTAFIVTTCLLVQATTPLKQRTHPEAMLWVSVTAECIAIIACLLQTPKAASLDGLAITVNAYAIARWAHRPLRHLIAAAIPLTALATAEILVNPPVLTSPTITPLASIILAAIATSIKIAAGALVGYTISNNHKRTQAEKQTLLAEERLRIARELHDTTAHHLSSIAIQTTAARATLHTHPHIAEQHLQGISHSITAALNDVRATVTTLRTTTEAETNKTPQPTLDNIPSLITQSQQLGMNITTQGPGLNPTLTAPQQQTTYRVLQEALTNARKHAPQCPVTVTLNTNALVVQTHGKFSPATPQGGSLSMHERATSTGATLTNQPTTQGWEVTLTWTT